MSVKKCEKHYTTSVRKLNFFILMLHNFNDFVLVIMAKDVQGWS